MKYFFKKIILLVVLSLLITSCSDDSSSSTELQPEVPQVQFNVTINAPNQNRDYSYANYGSYGIFEDPAQQKDIKGKILITSGSQQVTNNDFIVKWSSNIDGILSEGTPDGSYNTNYLGLLSKGMHTVKLEAYLNGFPETVKKDSLIVSNIIKLNAEGQGNNIKLDWNKYEGSDFVSYKIYRGNFEPVGEIFNIDQTNFIDSEIDFVAKKYSYQVVVNTSTPSAFIYGSTITECSGHPALEMPYYVTKTIYDSYRNRIYSLLSPGSSGGTTILGIAILNPDNMQIENTILQSEVYNDASISSDGNTMYLTQKHIDKITVLNLNTFTTTQINTSTNGWGFHKVEDTNTDFLICHKQPPTSGNTEMYLVNKNTGACTSFITNSHGDIEYNSINNKVYLGESNTSDGVIRTANFTGTTLVFDNVMFPTNWPGITYPSPFVLLSPDKNSVFWENYQLTATLNLIREFPSKMLACSPGNIYLSSDSKVYNYNSLNTILSYGPFNDPDTKHFIFTDDHTIIVTISIDDHFTDNPETTYFMKYILP